MSDKNIKELYDDIQTPAELRDRILSAMNNNNNESAQKTKPAISKLKQNLIIIAAIMSVIILMGAGLNMITVKYFDMDGNSWIENIPFSDRFITFKNDEQSIFERELRNDPSSENLLVLTKWKSG